MRRGKINFLETLNFYQIKSITLRDAIFLNQSQTSLIKNSFSLGIKRIKNQPDISSKNNLFHLFLNYHKKVDNGDIINGTISLKEEQEKIFSSIHLSNLSDEEKIFLEFCMGLSRFILAIQLTSKFLLHLQTQKKICFNQNIFDGLYNDTTNVEYIFFNRLSTVAAIGVKLIDTISSSYSSDDLFSDQYWSDASLFYSKFKQFADLAKTLVNIQYIPNNNKFLSIMQTIHWRGFGGKGLLLNEYTELSNLSEHAINHHSGYEIIRPFNKRMIVFKKPLDAILTATQKLITHFLEKQFPTIDTFQVHDFCSGPHYIAVKEIFKKMQHKYFNLTVSDVDGKSLISLAKEKNKKKLSLNFQITDVMYIDLMSPLNLQDREIEKYHLVTINLGLHQLPIDKIYEALRYFTMITKINGLISNLDASEKRYSQLMIIPGNIVDREGYVPYIEEIDLTRLMIVDHTNDYVKLPYPVVRFTQKVLNSIEKKIGIGPYMVSFYIPIKIELSNFYKLNELWISKKYNDCDQFVKKYIKKNWLFI